MPTSFKIQFTSGDYAGNFLFVPEPWNSLYTGQVFGDPTYTFTIGENSTLLSTRNEPILYSTQESPAFLITIPFKDRPDYYFDTFVYVQLNWSSCLASSGRLTLTSVNNGYNSFGFCLTNVILVKEGNLSGCGYGNYVYTD